MPDPLIDDGERHRMYLARQRRLRDTMRELEVPVLLVVDPIRIRYATGARNMQVWSSREASRCLLLFAEGPAILFEYPGFAHLAEGLPTLDEVRTGEAIPYVGPGSDTRGAARAWARTMAGLIREHVPAGSRVAIDRLHFEIVEALRAERCSLYDAEIVTGVARSIKLPEEMPQIRESVLAVEAAVTRMSEAIRPGMTENEIYAHFHHGLIERDAEYVTTRLLAGGERSFPYFCECGPYPVEAGDLIAFDTDAIGVDGYAVDFSRTFLCGDAAATSEQRTLYRLALEQLEWNVALFRGGSDFRSIAERAWPVPEDYRPHSYYVIAHGIGMSGEYPAIPHLFQPGVEPAQGTLCPGMTLCVESYLGTPTAGQGVKLEQHLLVTEGAPTVLSRFPFDGRLLGREL